MRLLKQDRYLVALLLGWAVLALAALFLRPLWPVDETRYLAVAWEMWQRGDFWCPISMARRIATSRRCCSG